MLLQLNTASILQALAAPAREARLNPHACTGAPEERRAHTAEAECSPSEMTRRTLTVAQVATSDFTDGPEQPTEEEGLDPASRFPMRTAQRVKRLWCKGDIISIYRTVLKSTLTSKENSSSN